MTEPDDTIIYTVRVLVDGDTISIKSAVPRKEKENQNGRSYRRGSYYKPSKQHRRLTRRLKKSYKNKYRFYK